MFCWLIYYLCVKIVIMEENLTLKINESILRKALRYAHKNKIDLSVVIEDFLAKFVDDSKQQRKIVVSNEVKELIGILTTDGEASWKDQKADYLVEKYK